MKPTLRYQLTFEGSWPMSVTFLDSPKRLAAGNQLGMLYIWDLPDAPPAETPMSKNGKKREAPDVAPAKRFDGHTNVVTHLEYDAERRRLYSSSFDRSIRVWSLDAEPTGKADAVLDDDARREEVKRTKKDDALNRPGVPVSTYAATSVLEGHPDWVHSFALSIDGKRAVTGDASANVIVWDLEEKKPLARWKGHPWNWIVATAFAPNRESVLVSEFRYKRDDFDIPCAGFKVWNVDGSEKLDILKTQFPKLNPNDHSYGSGQMWRGWTKDGLIALAYSPDGKLIAAGQGGETDTGKVHLLDAETGKLVRDVSGHQYGITDLAFFKDGKRLATAGRDTCIRIVQVEDGKELAVLGTPRGGQFKDWISAISISADEKWIAGADISGVVSVWQIEE